MARKQIDTGFMPDEARQILEKAKERGVESNFLFTTTFERYLNQLKMCEKIKRLQDLEPEDGIDVRLTRLYTSTVSGANGTASTLVSIIKKLGNEGNGESKFKAFLDGFRDDDED